MKILGIISMLLFAFCFIPQIVSIVRTKNVSGISLWLWIMVVTGYAAGLIYATDLKDLIVIATYWIGFILSSLTLGLVVYYKRNRA